LLGQHRPREPQHQRDGAQADTTGEHQRVGQRDDRGVKAAEQVFAASRFQALSAVSCVAIATLPVGCPVRGDLTLRDVNQFAGTLVYRSPTMGSVLTKPQVRGGPPGDRTPNPRIKSGQKRFALVDHRRLICGFVSPVSTVIAQIAPVS
jgi:hypothetical protein